MNTISLKNPFGLITWLNALSGLLLLVLHKTVPNGIPIHWQLIYFIVMITMTGIPHGALDHVIAMETAARKESRFILGRFLGKYTVIILLYSILWYFFPSVSLLFFLLISAWHFGETDINGKDKAWIITISRMLWGSFVLMILLLSHADEVKWIIMRITHESMFSKSILEWVLSRSMMILIVLFSLATMCLTIAFMRKEYVFDLAHFVNLGIILAISTSLPLLPSFALYFGGWHAVKSFEFIFDFLKKTEKYKSYSPAKIWKEALPMTFLAVYGLLFMIYIWNASGLKTDPVPILFIFLSVITLPHLDVMDKMLRTNKNQSGQ